MTAGVTAYALFRQANKLKLIYNEESGQLVIDRKYNIKFCHEVFIESLVVRINGEIYRGYDYIGDEKPFDDALFVELPELEAGDLIEVRMKTRCAKMMTRKGKLAIF